MKGITSQHSLIKIELSTVTFHLTIWNRKRRESWPSKNDLEEKFEILRMKKDLMEPECWSIADYFVEIKRLHANLNSYRKIGEALDLSSTSVNDLRYGKSFPSEDTMLKMADLAGRSHIEAILDLRLRKSHGATLEVYKKLKGMFAESLTLLAIVIAIAVSSVSPAHAAIGNIGAGLYEKYTLSHHYLSSGANSKTKCDFPYLKRLIFVIKL